MNAVHVRDQKHELTPPRNRQAVIGLRDKLVTQHDTLLNFEVPAEISAWAGPVASLPRHPFCHHVKADC
ncbi:hypothetical protein V6N12_073399 [Hibiscus sabdariffa]|uniref:Uncharacterized protein n=1 Tax=Hibiscus sabdariffa TaxID=183260 RepID=A0ABR2BT79_9ROSI